MDTVVVNGLVLTMDEARRVIADGAVVIDRGRIVAVGSGSEFLAGFAPGTTIDARGAPVHPGFVECHNHTTLHTIRGAFGDTAPWDEVVNDFYVPYWNTVTDEEEHAGALLACLEMAMNGTTCFMEAGTAFEPDVVAQAAAAVGLRALVGDPFLWDMGGFTGDSPTVQRAPATTDRALRLLGGQLWRNDDADALIRGHIAIVGMASASEELELAAKKAADRAGVVLNKHQSYAPMDVADDDKRFGRHPLVHFEEIGALGPNCLFAHMNVLREDELEAVVRSGVSISWNPAASMMWGIGGATGGSHAELYRRGVNVGHGSDSSNWANTFDMGRNATLAVLAARDGRRDRTILTAEDALTMATINGARGVCLDDRIGSLEVGKRADIVIRTNDLPEMHPVTDPISNLVYAAGSKSVRTVLVDGRVIVEDGRPALIDPVEIYRNADAAARAALGRMGYRTPRRWPGLA